MADENKEFNVEDILTEMEMTSPPPVQEPTVPVKPVFQLNLDLDSEYGDIPDELPASSATPVREPEEDEPVHTTEKKKKRRVNTTGLGCLKGLIYAIVVLGLSGALAYFLILGGLDFTGITRSDVTVDIIVPAGANTEEVAELLEKNNLIDQKLLFRLYARLTGADGTWQPGSFSLQPDMGYKLLVSSLQTARVRDTVKVTIPEGFTVDEVAKRLETNGVCTVEEFYRAVEKVEYTDYEFIAAFADINKEDYDARYYALEGYLFPDTYEFYVGCSGETVVRKMLDAFDMRLDTTLRSAMTAKDLTMDELIILASIVQGEAASKDDMEKVAKVLWNRLENTDIYPKLQCDSTRDYVQDMLAAGSTIVVSNEFFDTYQREGLPAGPINNPGLDAIKAVLYPSEEEAVRECFFFATDYSTGKTYFSETYAQHERICRKYGIGMYG